MWYNDYTYSYNHHDCTEDLKNETWWNSQQNNSIWFNSTDPERYYIWQDWNEYHYSAGTLDEHADDFSDWLWDDVFDTTSHELHENPACVETPSDKVQVMIECEEFAYARSVMDWNEICWFIYDVDPCNMDVFSC